MSLLRRRLRGAHDLPGLRLRVPPVYVPLPLWTAGAVLTAAGMLLLWAARHPRTMLTLAAALNITVRGWWPAVAGAATLAVAGLGIWSAVDVDSFTAHAVRPAGRRLREQLTYRRHWQPATLGAGLHLTVDGTRYVPRLVRVTAHPAGDRLVVRMLPGQTVTGWRDAAPQLAPELGVGRIVVRPVPGDPRRVALIVRVSGRRAPAVTTPPAGSTGGRDAAPAPTVKEAPDGIPAGIPAPRPGAFPRRSA